MVIVPGVRDDKRCHRLPAAGLGALPDVKTWQATTANKNLLSSCTRVVDLVGILAADFHLISTVRIA